LTYTLGTGSSTTVVTTTLHSTVTQYLTQTITATRAMSSAGAETTGPAGESDITKTRSLTSTITNVVTVYPVQSSTVPMGTGSNNNGASAPSSAPAAYGTGVTPADYSSADTCEAKTVTVTATETETVTATPTADSTGKNVKPVASSGSVYYPTGSSSVVHGLPSTGFVTKAKPTGYSTSTPMGTAVHVTNSIVMNTAPVSDSYAVPTSMADAAAPSSYSAPAAYEAPAAYGRL
jgi:hypothetical protein